MHYLLLLNICETDCKAGCCEGLGTAVSEAKRQQVEFPRESNGGMGGENGPLPYGALRTNLEDPFFYDRRVIFVEHVMKDAIIAMTRSSMSRRAFVSNYMCAYLMHMRL